MIGTLINLIIYVIIVGLLLWLLQYVINNIPLFAPFRQFANVILMVIGVIFLIMILLSLTGSGLNLPKFGYLPALPTSV
jgi:hypothetical protein